MNFVKTTGRLLICALLCAAASVEAAKQPSLASRYGVIELTLKSTENYRNPVVEAVLTAEFVSPMGATNRVYGFWDGGITWRIRFSPDSPGKWTYRTSCTDATNASLNDVKGEFLCTPTVGKSRFDFHGPVRVAADGRHLEHWDRTPFFWLGDAVWEGAVRSRPKDWDYYAQARAGQQFTVAQWAASPGADYRKRTGYSTGEELQIKPEYFRTLDEKIVALNRAGLLSAIAPVWEVTLPERTTLEALPEEQAIQLLRYMLARWGAYNVAWVVTCEGSQMGGNVARWKRIGQAVFGGVMHGPVVIYPGHTYWTMDELRDEAWVGICGYQSGRPVNDDTMQWMLAGPVAQDWRKEPARPFINLALPFENEPEANGRIGEEAVRRAAYWSLLNAPAAGIGYGGQGVWNWPAPLAGETAGPKSKSPPEWQRSLFMPAAKQMAVLADTIGAMEFWKLRPAPELLAEQPGKSSPAKQIVAAKSEAGDVVVIYTPEEGILKLTSQALPKDFDARWIDPRSGAKREITEVTSDGSIRQFKTPGEGDWLLWIKGK
jgi:hypothetical protein